MSERGYVTPTLSEAAYLLVMGHELEEAFWDRAPTGRRMCFWRFHDDVTIDGDVDKFNQREAHIEPQEYVEIMDELKKGMYHLPSAPAGLRRSGS